MSEDRMEGLKHIGKIREYCDYLEEHLLNVDRAWKTLQVVLKHKNIVYDDFLYFTIDGIIREHDVSKFSPEEFIQYQRQFFPVGEEPEKSALAKAWEHHKAYNPHHWETWPTSPEHFPNEHFCHLVCMICDWMAMGMKFGDTAEEYYEKNKDKIALPRWAVKFIHEIFDSLRKESERE